MRHVLLLTLLLATTARGEEPLTNADVLRMLKDGVPPSVVSAKIKTSETRFDLTTDAIVTLTKAGVPESVLTAMLESTTPSTAAPAGAPPSQASGPDLLLWKQECEKAGWSDAICRPEESGITFPAIFYREGARTPGAGGEINVTNHRISASSLGREVFDIPWTDVKSFCAEFAWRNMFYLQTKDGEIKFDLGGGRDEMSKFFRKMLLSIRPEECPK